MIVSRILALFPIVQDRLFRFMTQSLRRHKAIKQKERHTVCNTLKPTPLPSLSSSKVYMSFMLKYPTRPPTPLFFLSIMHHVLNVPHWPSPTVLIP